MRAAIAREACVRRKISFTAGEEIPSSANTVVIGKIGSSDIVRRSQAWLMQIAHARSRGAQIFLDYTDHHIGFKSVMTDFYVNALKETTLVICPSNQMQTMLEGYMLGRECSAKPAMRVIADVIEIEVTKPKTKINDPVNMLWFGHNTNIIFLVKFLSERLPAVKNPKNLLILTNEQGVHQFQTLNPRIPNHIKINFAPWSISNMQQAAAYCDLCLIPSDPEDPRKSGVSPNRLITALGLGLPTAADNLKSYEEYQEYYFDLGSPTLSEFLEWPQKFHQQLREAQQRVVPRFFGRNIENNWLEILNLVN
jgi:hypothetical protein